MEGVYKETSTAYIHKKRSWSVAPREKIVWEKSWIPPFSLDQLSACTPKQLQKMAEMVGVKWEEGGDLKDKILDQQMREWLPFINCWHLALLQSSGDLVPRLAERFGLEKAITAQGLLNWAENVLEHNNVLLQIVQTIHKCLLCGEIFHEEKHRKEMEELFSSLSLALERGEVRSREEVEGRFKSLKDNPYKPLVSGILGVVLENFNEQLDQILSRPGNQDLVIVERSESQPESNSLLEHESHDMDETPVAPKNRIQPQDPGRTVSPTTGNATLRRSNRLAKDPSKKLHYPKTTTTPRKQSKRRRSGNDVEEEEESNESEEDDEEESSNQSSQEEQGGENVAQKQRSKEGSNVVEVPYVAPPSIAAVREGNEAVGEQEKEKEENVAQIVSASGNDVENEPDKEDVQEKEGKEGDPKNRGRKRGMEGTSDVEVVAISSSSASSSGTGKVADSEDNEEEREELKKHKAPSTRVKDGTNVEIRAIFTKAKESVAIITGLIKDSKINVSFEASFPCFVGIDGAAIFQDSEKLKTLALERETDDVDRLACIRKWWKTVERCFKYVAIFEHLEEQRKATKVLIEHQWNERINTVFGKVSLKYGQVSKYNCLGKFLKKYPRFLCQDVIYLHKKWVDTTYKLPGTSGGKNLTKLFEFILTEEEKEWWKARPEF